MPPNSIFSASQVMSARVDGLREVQQAVADLTRTAAADGGTMRGQMNRALLQLQRFALSATHVVTGRLKNSIFTELTGGGNTLQGYVATNVAYAWYEERRGGQHAFFERTVNEEGPAVNSLFDQPLGVLWGGHG